MGIYSDNFYSWLDRQNSEEKVAMDASVFKEEQHPRESKGHSGGGRFTKKPETLAKEDSIDDLDEFEECSPTEFAETISKAKNNIPEEIKWRVDVKPVKEYSHCKALLRTKGGSCVAVKENGNIVSLCRPDTDTRTRGRDCLKKAREKGGDRLDSFDGNWSFYVNNGFEPISWTPFNEDYAPDGWKKDRDQPENVVFFAYTGKTSKSNTIDKTKWLASHKPFEGKNGYDDAMRARDAFIDKEKEANND